MAPPSELAVDYVARIDDADVYFLVDVTGSMGGEIATIQDRIAGTIARDPELLAAARVIRDDLDARGVVRRRHAPSVNVPKAADAGR